jgi:hypothetical protein
VQEQNELMADMGGETGADNREQQRQSRFDVQSTMEPRCGRLEPHRRDRANEDMIDGRFDSPR